MTRWLVNNELKKTWTYMMEVLYWHLHAVLRLFILQVSDLMFFCHGLAFCHILVVVRSCLAHLHNYVFHTYLEATFSINSQNMWHVTITMNPLKGIEIRYWTFTIFKPYKPSHHNWHWVCQPCFNLGLLNTPFRKSSTGGPPYPWLTSAPSQFGKLKK